MFWEGGGTKSEILMDWYQYFEKAVVLKAENQEISTSILQREWY